LIENLSQNLRNYFEPSIKLTKIKTEHQGTVLFTKSVKENATSLKYLREGQILINENQGVQPMREIKIAFRKPRVSMTQSNKSNFNYYL